MGYVWYFVKLSIYHFNSNALYESIAEHLTQILHRVIVPSLHHLTHYPIPTFPLPDLPDSARIVKVTRTFDPMGPAMIVDSALATPRFLLSKIKDANVKDAMSRGLPSSGFRAPGPVVFDSKRAVVLTDVRHFGSQAYNEPLDIRRADFTGAACGTPFFLFPSPLFLSLPPPLVHLRRIFFSLTQSRTLAHAG